MSIIVAKSTGQEMTPEDAIKAILAANPLRTNMNIDYSEEYYLKNESPLFDSLEPVKLGDLMLMTLPDAAKDFVVFALGGLMNRRFRRRKGVGEDEYAGFVTKLIAAPSSLSYLQIASHIEGGTGRTFDREAIFAIESEFFDFLAAEVTPDATVQVLRTSTRKRLLRLFEAFLEAFDALIANTGESIFGKAEMRYQLKIVRHSIASFVYQI